MSMNQGQMRNYELQYLKRFFSVTKNGIFIIYIFSLKKNSYYQSLKQQILLISHCYLFYIQD